VSTARGVGFIEICAWVGWWCGRGEGWRRGLPVRCEWLAPSLFRREVDCGRSGRGGWATLGLWQGGCASEVEGCAVVSVWVVGPVCCLGQWEPWPDSAWERRLFGGSGMGGCYLGVAEGSGLFGGGGCCSRSGGVGWFGSPCGGVGAGGGFWHRSAFCQDWIRNVIRDWQWGRVLFSGCYAIRGSGPCWLGPLVLPSSRDDLRRAEQGLCISCAQCLAMGYTTVLGLLRSEAEPAGGVVGAGVGFLTVVLECPAVFAWRWGAWAG